MRVIVKSSESRAINYRDGIFFFFFFPYFDSRFLNDRRFDRGEKILVFFSFRGIDRGLIIIRKGNNCNYLWWNQFCVSWNNFEEWIFRDMRYSFFWIIGILLRNKQNIGTKWYWNFFKKEWCCSPFSPLPKKFNHIKIDKALFSGE